MFTCKIREKIRKIRKAIVNFREKFPSFYTKSLCGLCGIASYKLYKELKNELPIKLVTTFRHCFCVVNNIIIDITASQFFERKETRFLIRDKYKAFNKYSFYFTENVVIWDNEEDYVKYLSNWKLHNQHPELADSIEII